MRIAIIDPVGAKMGMNHYNDGLAGALAANGFNMYILSNYVSKKKNVTSRIFFNNINKSWMFSVLINLQGVTRSLLFCKKQKTDRILFHIFRGGLFDLFSLLLAKIWGLRTILIVHDVKTIDTDTPKFLKQYVLKKFGNTLVVHNTFSKNELQNFLGFRGSKDIHVIPHGNYIHALVTGNYTRNEAARNLNLDPQENYLLFLGQVKKSKGLDVLLNAMPFTKSSFKLIIAGKLRIKKFKPYSDLIEKSGLSDRILLKLNHIPEEEMALLFSISEAVILPYKVIYQSGILLLAMSYAKCAIVSDLPPFTDMITERQNGLIFHKNDPESLAAKIDLVFSGTFDAQQAGQEAKKTLERSHDWAEIAQQYSLLIKKT